MSIADDKQRVRRVIVIDDNRAIHRDFEKVLAQSAPSGDLASLEADLFGEPEAPAPPMAGMTFEVSFADQGEAGYRLVEEAVAAGRPYSVAFVDMRMPPGWDGVTTIKKLWEVDPELQCVICTAYSDYSWEDILSALGVSDRLLLLRKPFDPSEVCQLAAALSEKWHLARRAHLKLEQLRSMVAEQTAHLAESEARYALVAVGTNDGLWDWSFASGDVFYSPRWNELAGLASVEPVLAPLSRWLDLVHPDDRRQLRTSLGGLRDGVSEQMCIEYRLRHADGQYRWMQCRGASARGPNGQPQRAAGSQTDITNRKVAETQLRHDATHDVLTKLPNRVLFTERLQGCLAEAERDPAFRYAVLFMDLDRFKVINDSLGHLVGDELLMGLAKRLTESVSSKVTGLAHDGLVARLGGDEFVVLLEHLEGEKDGRAVAERLLAAASRPFEAGEHKIHTSISIGIAMGQAEYHDVASVLRDADTALYRAKSAGRGRFEVFTNALHVAAMDRWRTENELRLAVERSELVLLYQPITSLTTGKIVHFEALIRWNHPTRGLLAPGQFIPLAEESGLILPIGQWVLEEACRQIAAWRLRGVETSIAVNVASRQFAEPGFVELVKATLAEHRVSPDSIRIEVTEGTMMDPKAVDTCCRLADLGIRLHLDDFGTGYSSLSYLTRMPLRALKIDRSFVAQLADDRVGIAIVQTVLTLASALGMESIAEGVETVEQASVLRALHCESGQGFLWSKPVPADAAFELMKPRVGTVSQRPSLRPSMLPC